jgi:hypothetical protein
MAYPTTIDNFTNPASGDQLNSPSHSQQHIDINNAVEALEAKVGADSSAVTTSHDYKIAQLESGKQATLVSGTNIKTINSTSLLGSGDITVGGTPGGSDTQVQFNDGGSFGGDAGLTYNKTTKALTIGSGTDVVPVNIGSYAKVESKLNPDTEQSCSLTSTQSVDIQLGSDGYFNIYDTAGNTIFFIGDSAGLNVVPTRLTDGTGSDSTICGGDAKTNGDGGNVRLITGEKAGAGSDGSIYLSTQAGINNSFGILDLSSINTSNKTFTFPNASGTIALTNNIPVKASGSELDTGTNNTKFATAKALADSKYFKSDETVTLTNKRITPRVSTETSSATPTINTDNVDAHSITALATDITSFTTNLSGTPTNFQKLIIRIKDDGTSRSITWGSSFEAKGVDLPTATTKSKVLTVGFIYDTVTSKWGCVASSQEA